MGTARVDERMLASLGALGALGALDSATIRLERADDEALKHLCEELTATDLCLIYRPVGATSIP